MAKVKIRQYPTVDLLAAQEKLPAVPKLRDIVINIEQYGWGVPLVITQRMEVLCGCEKLLALISIEHSHMSCVWREDLSDEQYAALERLHRLEQDSEEEWDRLSMEADLVLMNCHGAGVPN